MLEGKQTVAGAYQKIAEHERDCERRYGELQTSIALLTDQGQSIKAGVRMAIAGIVTIALGLIGWLGVQVYELNREASLSARPASRQAVATVGLPEKVLSFQGTDWQAQTVNRRSTP